MAIQFRKRIKLFSGFTLNFGKKGVSASAGPRGAKVTVSKKGIYGSASVPGSGVYVREKISGTNKKNKRAQNKTEVIQNENKVVSAKSALFGIAGASSLFLGIFIPILGGSWWFLLIMPVIGFLVIFFGEKIIDKVSGKN